MFLSQILQYIDNGIFTTAKINTKKIRPLRIKRNLDSEDRIKRADAQ